MSEPRNPGSTGGDSSFFGPGSWDDLEKWTYDWEKDGPLECDAWEDWPKTGRRCGDDAYFSIGRVADTDLPVCPRHLGPVLCNMRNLEWPLTEWSDIEWVGPGERPPNAMSPEQAQARILRGP